MAEERKFCRLCKNLGIDCETGTFYCSLSHRPDKLPNNLKCDEFSLCVSIKRLMQERDEWKKKYEDVANENLKEIYKLIKKNDCWRGIVNVVCSKLEQENKELKEENIEYDEELAIEKLSHKSDLETLERYRSALEEIRKLVQWHKVADEVRLKSIMHYIIEVLK